MPSKPRVEIRDVTPEWATSILEKHDASIVAGSFKQRNVIRRVVESYARDMKAGNWGLTGQGITFDTEGNLLDGQHRLYAVVRAGVVVKMLVMWDVPPTVNDRLKTINTMDSGKKRDLGGQLKIEGVTNYFNHASATRLLGMLSSDDLRVNLTPAQGVAIYSVMGKQITAVMEILEKSGNKRKYSGAVLAPLVLTRTFARDEADLFATELATMTGLKEGSPVLAFNRYLDRGYAKSHGTEVQIATMSVLATALKAYIDGENVDSFRGGTVEAAAWLKKNAKNAIAKIREVSGMELTMSELERKE